MDGILVVATLLGIVVAALLLHHDGVRVGREQTLTEMERRRRRQTQDNWR